MTTTKKGLGRGIGALLPQQELDQLKQTDRLVLLDINDISPLSNQPRKSFDDEKLAELAQSIRENGVLQPILVREKSKGNYTIIAGERRWRAARLAELREIPAIVRKVDDEVHYRQALIENIQREDLNALEAAQAYQLLLDQYGMTQEALAESVGKSRSAIANTLRLNRLPQEIQEDIQFNRLSEGHARALLAVDDEQIQIDLSQQIQEKQLSVRETEALVRRVLMEKTAPQKKDTKPADERAKLSIREVEQTLSKKLGSKVKLRDREGKGVIKIPYSSLDDLDRLIELIQSIKH